jgi:hypothetical protein
MTRDPYEGSIYDPASLHRYNYARANPVNYVDPSGRSNLTEYALDLSLNTIATAGVVTSLGFSVKCAYFTVASSVHLVGETLGQQVDQFTPLFKSCAAKITTTQFVTAWAANTALLALNVFAGPALTAVGDWMFGAEQGVDWTRLLTEEEGSVGFGASWAGSMEDAAAAQARAQELNSMRRAWESQNGTTAVANVLNMNTGEAQTWIATESESIPSTWNDALQQNEVYVPGAGHAEQTIVNALGDEWQITSGGASRNICIGTCQPLLEGQELTIGGPTFRGMSDKTPYRRFWSEQ